MRKYILAFLIAFIIAFSCTVAYIYDRNWKNNHESYYGNFETTTIFGITSRTIKKFYVVKKMGCLWDIQVEGHRLIADMHNGLIYDSKTYKPIIIKCEEEK